MPYSGEGGKEVIISQQHFWRLKLIYIKHKHWALTSQRTQFTCIRNINQWTPYRQKCYRHYEYRVWTKFRVFGVNSWGTYNYHWAGWPNCSKHLFLKVNKTPVKIPFNIQMQIFSVPITRYDFHVKPLKMTKFNALRRLRVSPKLRFN
jgi:hypothetical protein